MKTLRTFSFLSGLVLSAGSLFACPAVPPALAPEPATFAFGGQCGGCCAPGRLSAARKK